MQVAVIFGLFCHLLSASGTLVMMPKNVSVEVKNTFNKLGSAIVREDRVDSAYVSCQMSSDPKAKLKSPSITWQRLDSNATVSEERIEVSSSESDGGGSFESWLTVKNPRTQDMTAYRCVGRSGNDNASAVAAFISVPLLLISTHGGGIPDKWSEAGRGNLVPDLVVHPGQALTLICDAVSGYHATVAWYRKKSLDDEEVLSANGSRVHFPRLSYTDDRGFYVCRSSNQLGSNRYVLYLRVSNPKAYLVPLIILLVLILVVVVITVAYEIHKNQKNQLGQSMDESTRSSKSD